MKNLRNKIKSTKGITLIALVITIIILLILAGITISQLSNSGLFEKAKIAKEQYQNAQDYEETQIAKYTNEINSYVDGTRLTSNNEVRLLKKSGVKNSDIFTLEDSIKKYKRIKITFGVDMPDGAATAWGNTDMYTDDIVLGTDENVKKSTVIVWVGSNVSHNRILHIQFSKENEIKIIGIEATGWSGSSNYELRIYGCN